MTSMQELSEYLKSERERQGLSLHALSERAHVSVSMLRHLEEGEYDSIGTSLLIRNFVRAYCSVLAIDPEPLIEKYAPDIHACDGQDRGIQRYRSVVKALKTKRRIGILPVLFLLIVTAGGVYGGTWLWKRYERQSAQQSITGVFSQQELPSDLPEKEAKPQEPDAKIGKPPVQEKGPVRHVPTESQSGQATERLMHQGKPAEGVVAKPAAVGESPSEVLPDEKPSGQVGEAGKKQVFSVEAEQKTWIQVKVDNKAPQEALLQPGEKREWEAEESMQVVVGNAGGVRMMWNGTALNVQGKPGSVLRFRLPEQGTSGDNRT